MTDHVIRLVRAGPEGDNSLSAAPPAQVALVDALSNLDDLRRALTDGRIKAFYAVGLAADHTTYAWSGKSAPTTVLELHGAWHAMAAGIEETFG